MVAEVAIKISRREVTPQSQALWDRGTLGGFNYLHAGYFSCVLSSAVYFSKSPFSKIISGIPSQCQTVQI